MRILVASILSMFLSIVLLSSPAQAVVIGWIEIETRILEGDPQAGMKSRQKITLDQNIETGHITFSTSFVTGTTKLGCCVLDSVRNSFELTKTNFSLEKNTVRVDVKGSTASGVGFMPNINYSFSIKTTANVEQQTVMANITGCHDGYPAHKVDLISAWNKKRTTIYDFKHKSLDLIKLFGSCDIQVNASKVLNK